MSALSMKGATRWRKWSCLSFFWKSCTAVKERCSTKLWAFGVKIRDESSQWLRKQTQLIKFGRDTYLQFTSTSFHIMLEFSDICNSLTSHSYKVIQYSIKPANNERSCENDTNVCIELKQNINCNSRSEIRTWIGRHETAGTSCYSKSSSLINRNKWMSVGGCVVLFPHSAIVLSNWWCPTIWLQFSEKLLD